MSKGTPLLIGFPRRGGVAPSYPLVDNHVPAQPQRFWCLRDAVQDCTRRLLVGVWLCPRWWRALLWSLLVTFLIGLNRLLYVSKQVFKVCGGGTRGSERNGLRRNGIHRERRTSHSLYLSASVYNCKNSSPDALGSGFREGVDDNDRVSSQLQKARHVAQRKVGFSSRVLSARYWSRYRAEACRKWRRKDRSQLPHDERRRRRDAPRSFARPEPAKQNVGFRDPTHVRPGQEGVRHAERLGSNARAELATGFSRSAP